MRGLRKVFCEFNAANDKIKDEFEARINQNDKTRRPTLLP